MKIRMPQWLPEGRKAPLVAALVLMLAAGVVLATHFVAFEVDANIALDLGTQDWANALNSTTPDPTQIVANSSPPSAVDNPASPGTAVLLFDPLASGGLTDSSTFTGGSTAKETAPSIPAPPPEGGITNWQIVSGNVPSNKDDISLVYLWIDDAANNLVMGLERLNENGDAHIDFAVDHLPWQTCPNDPDSLCPVRTAGDLLLAFDIGGNGTVTSRLFVWEIPGDGVDERAQAPFNISGGTDGCDGQITGGGNLSKSCVGGKTGLNEYGLEEVSIPPGTSIEHILNSVPITAGPWGSFGQAGAIRTSIPPLGFFEAYVNLDALGFTPKCPGTATVSVRSRSSSSIDSSLMDLAGPVNLGESSLSVTATLTPGNCALNFSYLGTASSPDGPILDADAEFHWDFFQCVGACDTADPPGDDTLVGSVADDADSPPPFDVSASGAGMYYGVLTVTQAATDCVGSGVSDPVQVNAPLTAVQSTLDTQVLQCSYSCALGSNSNSTGAGVLIIPNLSGGSGHYHLDWRISPAAFDNCSDQDVDSPDTGPGCIVDIPDSAQCALVNVKLALTDRDNPDCGIIESDFGFLRKQTILKFAPAPLTNNNVTCQGAASGSCTPTP